MSEHQLILIAIGTFIDKTYINWSDKVVANYVRTGNRFGISGKARKPSTRYISPSVYEMYTPFETLMVFLYNVCVRYHNTGMLFGYSLGREITMLSILFRI